MSLTILLILAIVLGPFSKQGAHAQQPYPAPPLSGGAGWLNTSRPIDLRDLRGKIVLLDFWTYCCINCIHILPELKKLEKAYPNELVVIGVHSAKFDTEKDSKNIEEAVLAFFEGLMKYVIFGFYPDFFLACFFTIDETKITKQESTDYFVQDR